jgi:hypothetical protein
MPHPSVARAPLAPGGRNSAISRRLRESIRWPGRHPSHAARGIRQCRVRGPVPLCCHAGPASTTCARRAGPSGRSGTGTGKPDPAASGRPLLRNAAKAAFPAPSPSTTGPRPLLPDMPPFDRPARQDGGQGAGRGVKTQRPRSMAVLDPCSSVIRAAARPSQRQTPTFTIARRPIHLQRNARSAARSRTTPPASRRRCAARSLRRRNPLPRGRPGRRRSPLSSSR